MQYSSFVALYESLSKTSKKLEKTQLLADFLPSLKGHEEWIYLLRGRVFPDYDSREFGISTQLALKAISRASGVALEEVAERFKKIGDLGDVALEMISHKKQEALFSKPLSVDHVFTSLRKLAEIEGEGTIDRKLGLCAELLTSAEGLEARYLIRTLLSDLRVGVADALLVDSITRAFFTSDFSERVQQAYDLLTDFALILRMAFQGERAFQKVKLVPGRPLNVMLAVKVTSFEEAFRICGKPAAIEHKYDGFRVVITRDGKAIRLFTRRLEEVTKQFPDIVEFAREYVDSQSYILDAEAVGFDPKKRNYLPFESVSQRIKRKHNIGDLLKSLPVEVNVFDVLSLNGENTVDLPFEKRRALLQKIVRPEPWKLRLATQVVTADLAEAEKFYKNALKIGEEGVMVKKIDAPYKAGRAVGYMVKMKPETADLDVVIIGGEYGTGKRAGGLTSFTIACREGDSFLEIGKVSSGLKEKAGEGTSYGEINSLLQPLIIGSSDEGVRVKPKVIVSVTYQNIQKSPTYSSGYALRFPRITHYRPERGVQDIASLQDIEREFKKGVRKAVK